MKIVIRFRIRTKKGVDRNAPHYIYCRLTVNGVQARSDMATGVKCLPDEWDNKAQRIKGHSETARQQNIKLSQIRDDLDTIYNELRKYDKPISAEVIKQAYVKKSDLTPRTLLVYYQKYLDEYLKDRIQPQTMRTWVSRRNILQEFIQQSLKRKDVDLVEVTGNLLKEYQRFHAQLKGNSLNHASRAVAAIKCVMDFAVVEEVLDHNATRSYKPPRDRTKAIKFLTQDELTKLASCPYYDDRLQKVVDCFLLQAYTGMAYNELVNFNAKKHLTTDTQGLTWIMIYRGKTNELSTIPVLKSTREILEKYRYQLPVVSNQKMNDFIKEAATVAGLSNISEISTHVARKTAGMYLLNAGLRMESVSKILGHKSIKITERYYATLNTKSLADDLRRNGLL